MPRYAQLHISGEWLADILTRGIWQALPVDHCLPDDVRIAGAYTVREGVVGLILESASFPVTPAWSVAEKLPVLEPVRVRSVPHRALSATLPSTN